MYKNLNKERKMEKFVILVGEIDFPNKIGEVTCHIVRSLVLMEIVEGKEEAKQRAEQLAKREGHNSIIPALSKFPVIIKG